MKNQMERTWKNEMEGGGMWGSKELNLSYYHGGTILITIYAHHGSLV